MTNMNLCLVAISALAATAQYFLAHPHHADHDPPSTPAPPRSRHSIPIPQSSSAHL